MTRALEIATEAMNAVVLKLAQLALEQADSKEITAALREYREARDKLLKLVQP
jgi:hypothetical protein